MYIGFDFETGFDLCTLGAQDIPLALALIAAFVVLELFLALNWDGRLRWTLPTALLLYTAFKAVGLACAIPGSHEPAVLAKFLPLVLLAENLPTLLLAAVCALCKRRLRRNAERRARQLDKIRIKDL